MAKSLETARDKQGHLDGLDDDAFMQEWQVVADRALKDRELLKQYSKEHQRRERLAQLNLEPGDIALLQSVKPEGIETAEQMGEV